MHLQRLHAFAGILLPFPLLLVKQERPMAPAHCLLWKSAQQLRDLLLRSSSEMPFLPEDAKLWPNSCF